MDDRLAQLLAQARHEGWIDWVQGPADHHALLNGCRFDVKAAEHARAFFAQYLKHTTDRFAGQPFELLDWQYREIIGRLFGWRRANGLRRFNKAYISTAKKQGKTSLLAGLALYLLLTNGPGTEIYSAAADREQASILYREAAAMVRANHQLKRAIRCRDSTKTLIGQGRNLFRALSADAKTKEGLNAAVVLADELHIWPGRELYDTLDYAGSARANPLFLIITTAGDDLNSICGEEYTRAKRWLAGEYVDDSYFAFIAEADPADDWEAPETWAKANPSLGITTSLEKFRQDLIEAKESPAKENHFRRYRLNQWVSVAGAWLSVDALDNCPSDLDPAQLEGRECWAGLDLSATDDTTALALLFPHLDDDGVDVLSFFWLPEDNITALEKKHRVSYRAWARQKLFRLTPGNVVDYQAIRQEIGELAKVYPIKRLAIDRKFQGQQLETELMEDGFDVVPTGGGWISQDIPAKELERLTKAKRFNYGGHPVMRWHLSNVVVEIDKNENYSLSKKRSRSKIDGAVAVTMGLFAMMNDRSTAGSSYYEENPEPILI